MKKQKIIIKKTFVASALVIIIAAFNFLTPLFTVVKGGSDYLFEKEFYRASGFSLAFSGYPPIVESTGNTLRVLCIFHLAVSVLLALALGAFALIKRTACLGRLGTACAVLSAIISVLYFVIGIIAYSDASDYAGLYYVCETFTFIPFIITVILTAFYFYAKHKLPDELRF